MYRILFFLVLTVNIAQADVYVLTAPDKSVQGLSEQDDMVVPDSYTKSVIKNKNISDLPINLGEEKMYDFDGSKFKLNSIKVEEKNRIERQSILDNKKRSEDRVSAINKLKGLGLTDDEAVLIIK